MTLVKKNKVVNKISVITVNFNTASYVNKLIKSLQIIDNYIQEIIIIDNNSNNSQPINTTNKTKIILNGSNLGFSKAVNQGIKVSKSEYILLINPDCYLENSSILQSIQLLIKDNQIGIVGGKIKTSIPNKYHMTANNKANFMTGLFEFTNLKKIFPNNYFSKKFWVETKTIHTITQVESICGAYMLIRKHIGSILNLFDERYFLYMEDVDFGNKVNSLGYKVFFDPRSEIVHVGGKSSNSKYNIVLLAWYISRKKYFKKHLRPFESLILLAIFSIEEKILTIIKKIQH
ncbi:hypothetical protein CO168_01530 [Candidatus Shapirobacteria bacterium CG_4_9_14_3_um_filter_36_12]|uniref:Glycosyltransferase 2-like domain-containing protein n=4 Tax=Candidatus Shapironibacteriota TaxID=1752721 RepID=A0A1J5HSH4_9BACT|nr:MAG: hypothetical protein AUK05_00440 [Candidatus Shapirobacteria bacterium CG2_30_35_20]PIV07158.1 MAG: hypothetical protein COS53_03095 [Candidatus Shapirobacteria bacterium CG03_land_8_20_14_0_80_35_14]PIX68363.1 MAG: hypothetical protein COZ41_00030 [Candidatus Shapirobacteria bacterium CG_4_10_14_3_um_filter_35_13]PJA51117.1 MAG: hypothetical protein CO168_01530 [Candidatus Shapirobacteria bacterium CG_4_9_14_3_um_filter_36_12]